MADRPSELAPRICVVLPTYNNAPTLAGVVRQVQAHLKDVIVVNDGCTDHTDGILSQFPTLTVIRHAANRGKGAALLDGFARAKEMGFTHAITIDTDGQHVIASLPVVLRAVAERPKSIVIGVRDLAGAGRRMKSRLLRTHSNFWVWVETGKWVHDTQSGFRAYPLETILSLDLRSRKYDFEIESLVKAMWLGTPIVEERVAVEYGPGSRSHFRPLRDFLLVSRLNVTLVARRLVLPKPLWGVWHLKSFREQSLRRRFPKFVRETVAEECRSPAVFGLSVGLGVFFGIIPIWGLQMAAAVAAAHLLRLSKAVALVASNISIPPMIPVILYASLVLGRLALTGHIDYSLRLSGLTLASAWNGVAAYVVGSFLLGAGMGIVAGATAWIIARIVTHAWRGGAACSAQVEKKDAT